MKRASISFVFIPRGNGSARVGVVDLATAIVNRDVVRFATIAVVARRGCRVGV